MIIGIDASNIISGGGLIHLAELLKKYSERKLNKSPIIVFASDQTIKKMPQSEVIVYKTHKYLNRGYIFRLMWQSLELKESVVPKVDILFVPGGVYLGSFYPFITMAQNLLPFDDKERARYGFCKTRIRLYLLKLLQGKTFQKSNGIIFLSKYSKKKILDSLKKGNAITKIIPHGVSQSFFKNKLVETAKEKEKNNFKLLYVSIIDVYKHQKNVAKAVGILRDKNIKLQVDFVGPSYTPELKKFKKYIYEIDPNNEFIRYLGPVDYKRLNEYYFNADGFVFASTCETFGMILLEAMAAGLPIACSNKSTMPEILKDAGFYFDAENIESIGNAIEKMIHSPIEREQKAQKAYNYAKEYSWGKCAESTFSFIKEVADRYYKM